MSPLKEHSSNLVMQFNDVWGLARDKIKLEAVRPLKFASSQFDLQVVAAFCPAPVPLWGRICTLSIFLDLLGTY